MKGFGRFCRVGLLLLVFGVFLTFGTAGADSCIGTDACTGVTGTVGAGSCNGFEACFAHLGNVGAGSCNDTAACYRGVTDPHQFDVPDNSCNGEQACYFAGDMGAGSCNGYFACEFTSGSVVGAGSCNGDVACRYDQDIVVGAGSCNGDFACYNIDGPVGDCQRNLVYVAACDTTPPDLTVPADFTVDATSPDGATVEYDATATDDGDGPITPTCDPPSGSTFPLGATLVTCTATDAAGNEGSASFTVTVNGADEQLVALLDDVTAVGSKSLADKVKHMQKELAKGKVAHVCKDLDKFINDVNKQATGKKPKLTTAEADDLIAQAENIKATLGC